MGVSLQQSGWVFLFSSVVAVCTAGCGGGGGSASFNTTPVAITTVNAPQVSAQTALISGAMGSTGSTGGGGATAASVHPQVGGLNLMAVLLGQVKWLAGAQGPAPAVRAMIKMAKPQAVTNCVQSGSYSVTVLSPTSGSITYTNCVDSATSGTLNGTLSLSSLVVSDPNFTPPWNMSAQINLSNFSITDASHLYVLNGSSGLTDAMLADGVTETLGMTNGPVDIAIDGHANALSGFTLSLTENSSTQVYSTSLDGTLDSGLLGGRVTIDTTTAFGGVNIDLNNPDTGSMTIHGAGNSSVVLTATGAGAVTLQVDADGNGVIDPNGTSNTTWNDLATLL
jgi:hypothetical protein